MWAPPNFVFNIWYSHFYVVHVESEGPYTPERLLPEAIKVMREKLVMIRKAAEALLDQDGGDVDVQMADV